MFFDILIGTLLKVKLIVPSIQYCKPFFANQKLPYTASIVSSASQGVVCANKTELPTVCGLRL